VGLSRGQPIVAPHPVPADAPATGVDDWAVGLAPPALPRWLGETLVGEDWLGLAPFRREMAARDLFVLLLAGPRGVGRGLAGPTSAGRLPDPRGTARAALALARAAGRALAS